MHIYSIFAIPFSILFHCEIEFILRIYYSYILIVLFFSPFIHAFIHSFIRSFTDSLTEIFCFAYEMINLLKFPTGCYDHYIYVISRRHGNTLWQLKTGESVKCSPVVSKVSGFAFIGSHDHHMYAIDTQKLSQIWCTYCGGGSVFGSPALSGDFKLLFVGTLGSNLVAIDSETGVVKWKLTMDRPIFTSPLCIDDDICFCCVDGYVHVVASSGCLRWSLKIPGPIFSSPSIAPSFDVTRFVLGSHDKAVYCISNGGELKWRTQLDSPIFATPTVVPRKGNLCDGSCEEKGSSAEFLVFVCSTDGKLYVLTFGDGTIVKTHVFSNEVFSSPVVFGSSMVVGCRDNNVYCLSL